MTALEIDQAIYEIIREKHNECQRRLEDVPPERKMERKALIIEREMYELCNRAGTMWHGNSREDLLVMRQRVIGTILQRYPRLQALFTGLDEEEKKIFIAALQAEIFLRDQIFHNYCDKLRAAQDAGDVTDLFALRIKVGSCESVFKAWEAWRVENHIYPGLLAEGLS